MVTPVSSFHPLQCPSPRPFCVHNAESLPSTDIRWFGNLRLSLTPRTEDGATLPFGGECILSHHGPILGGPGTARMQVLYK